MTDEPKRNEHASEGMVAALFYEWLVEKDWSDGDAFALSIDISNKLHELEKEGYLVVLRHDATCYHCGSKWPRKDGDYHVIPLCAECDAKRDKFHVEKRPDLIDKGKMHATIGLSLSAQDILDGMPEGERRDLFESTRKVLKTMTKEEEEELKKRFGFQIEPAEKPTAN